MITFQASGRFQEEPVAFTCAVDDSRIVISADPDRVFSLAQAIYSGIGDGAYDPANVNRVLRSRVFDLGCKPEITGWLQKVISVS